jgi:hypothetical protein
MEMPAAEVDCVPVIVLDHLTPTQPEDSQSAGYFARLISAFKAVH